MPKSFDDGTYLVHVPAVRRVPRNPEEALTWLEAVRDVLPDLHGDPRSLAFFPDDLEPAATNYDAVIAEIADRAFLRSHPRAHGAVAAMTSYDAGKMMEQMQQKIADLLGGMRCRGRLG